MMVDSFFFIEKNQDKFIDMGTRKIPIFPDGLNDMKTYIAIAGLKLIEQNETEFAYILVAKKSGLEIPKR